jgi:hypothetical protein
MAAGATLMSVAIVTIAALNRADRRFARRLESQDLVAQLAEALRRDVHAAQRAAWDEQLSELRLELAAGAGISYRLGADRWERQMLPAAAEKERPLDGVFQLPVDVVCEVTVLDAQKGQLVKLVMSPTQVPHDPSRLQRGASEIVVAVGRDLELLHP